ncbi:OprD family outer membrane porin [Azospira restricta]|uniref:Outer membrane porin, OprD family n=1 Tax=Azospira restricta TaxID=404405 RepID=A0A974SN99_9RHOO|nr:OprD family outer membrane porin [Azospira restricta]QRJ63292.1 outer membrane porin, OprD family [Azospira restricta]
MDRRIKAGMLAALIGGLPQALMAADGEHNFELKARGVYWDDESLVYPTKTNKNPKATDYQQSALGLQLNYQSPYWGGIIGTDISAYGVARLGDSGTPTSNLVDVGNNGQLRDSYLTAGQALVKLKYQDFAQAKFGRQLQNSLLLKSTNTRAVPDTYSGASASLKPLAGLTIYGAVYDEWRSRSTGHFEKFRTEATAAKLRKEIDYVGILGASYAKGPVSVTAEYLNSKDYLSKFGLVGAYTIPLDKNSLKLSAGLFTSRDAGSLFVCSAEKELDCTGTSRLDNDGKGVYLDAEWKVSNFTVGAAVAKFDGFWIEDNFAVDATKTGSLTQDHGTNPFPTAAGLGPDLSNRDEIVGSVRLAYDWKNFVPGLTTGFKYSRGSGAKSSNLNNSAEGREHYREFTVAYALPFVKNLSARYVYMNYDSHVENGSTSATIKGMPRQDWEQHRFYVDYSYQF